MPGRYRKILDAEPPLGYCYPELGFESGSQTPFGYNWTHPGEMMTAPFVHLTTRELGANPAGQKSAAIASLMREPYETSGYVAVIIPLCVTRGDQNESDLPQLSPLCPRE